MSGYGPKVQLLRGARGGYANRNIRSAEEVPVILAEEGSPLPHVPGINNQAGVDPNPGYRQILAEDPEGNLINFSEYLEY